MQRKLNFYRLLTSIFSDKATSTRVKKDQKGRTLRLESLEERQLLATCTWTGGVGGDFNTASNWSGNVVPGVNDDVIINDYVGSSPDRMYIKVSSNQTSSSMKYAACYRFKSLTIGSNVELLSYGISNLSFIIEETLSFGNYATIRVRNGYYANAPASDAISKWTVNNAFLADGATTWTFDGAYGKGGNGGAGNEGQSVANFYVSYSRGGSGGGGGGGGFGGGAAGSGGSYGTGQYWGYEGKAGTANGGNGGHGGANTSYGTGGGAKSIGTTPSNSGTTYGSGGSGGGGNGGSGSRGLDGVYNSIDSYYIGAGGNGGGGGGYGGGTLAITARFINYNDSAIPSLLVNGQKGGSGYQYGQDGKGGLLVVQTTNLTQNQVQNLSTYNTNTKLVGKQAGGYGHGTLSTSTTAAPKVLWRDHSWSGDATLSSPTISSVSVNNASATIKWNAVSGASKYILWRSFNGTSGGTYFTVSSTSYTDSDLTSGIAYVYRVVAVRSNGRYSQWSDTKNILVPPSSPKNLSAEIAGEGVLLSWNSTYGAETYSVQRSTNNSTWTTLTAALSSTTYSDGSVADKTKYYYRVCAKNSGGTSDAATVSITTPTSVKSISLSASAAKVGTKISTSLTPSGATVSYQWYYGNSSTDINYKIVGATNSYYTPTKNDAGYYLKVVATGSGNYFKQVSASTGKVAPNSLNAPTNVKATKISDTKMSISWSTVTNATGYRIKTRKSYEEYSVYFAPYSTTETSITIDIASNTSYYAKVQAFGDSTHDDSEWTEVFYDPNGAAPNINLYCNQYHVSVTWSEVTNATGYEVMYSKKADFSNAQTELCSSTRRSKMFDHINYDISQGFYIKVRAENNVWSEAKFIAPSSGFSDFSIRNLSVSNTNSVNFTCKYNVNGVSNYTVRYSTSPDFENVLSKTFSTSTSEINITIPGLEKGTRYYFRAQLITQWFQTYNSDTQTITTGTDSTTLKSVLLSTNSPEVGVAITAKVSNPNDAGATWQWYRGRCKTTMDAISGATNARYTPVEADRGYYLMAEAKGTVLYSGWSSATTNYSVQNEVAPDPVKLSTPSISSSSSTENSITINWSKIANASSYVVEYKLSSASSYTQKTVSSTATSYTITGLSASSAYNVRMYAVGDGTNYSNSDRSAVKTITTSNVTPADDSYEPNDTLSAAANLGTITSTVTKSNLIAGANKNQDWFKFAITSAGTADSSVRVTYTHVSGSADVDLYLYNSSGTEVGSSSSTNGTETIPLTGLAAGTYYIKVFNYKSVTTGASYSLTIAPPTDNDERETPSTVVTTNSDFVDAYDGVVSLREAIAYAGTNGLGTVVTFAASLKGKTITLSGTALTVSKPITIDATSLGTSKITIDANDKSSVFNVSGGTSSSPVVMKNLNLLDGKTVWFGGLLYNKGYTQLTDVSFSGGFSYYGGAVLNEGVLTLTSAKFSDNRAFAGGAVYNKATGNVTATTITATGNIATNYGGVVYNAGGSVDVVGGTFETNTSNNRGGVFYVASGTLNVNSSTIYGNVAKNFGGAIYNAGTVTATNSVISGGSSIYGGAIANYNTLTVVSCDLTGNTATQQGGAIYHSSSIAVNITGGAISSNSAYQGGGLYVRIGTVRLTGTEMKTNSATHNGGAIYSKNQVVLTNCVVSNNSAKYYGGGIYNEKIVRLNGTTTVDGNSTETGNSPNIHTKSGGQVIVSSELADSVFDETDDWTIEL